MAEALKGRSEAAIRNRLSKLRSKGEKGEDLYIGGRGSAHTEELPEAQPIWDTLIFYASI